MIAATTSAERKMKASSRTIIVCPPEKQAFRMCFRRVAENLLIQVRPKTGLQWLARQQFESPLSIGLPFGALIRKDYIYSLFEKQCEIALKNLEKIYSVVGNKICVTFLTGTDFGTQCGPFISSDMYRDLYQPFHKEINNWIHKNTGWKTFMHSCGSIYKLIPDFIESGFDILNPVQCSASDMNASRLKKEFGDKITFWGGGVDTQKTLPFGSAGEVRDEVKLRMDTFGPGGGFVFNAIHNIQARVPIENLMAMFETFRDSRNY